MSIVIAEVHKQFFISISQLFSAVKQLRQILLWAVDCAPVPTCTFKRIPYIPYIMTCEFTQMMALLVKYEK